MATRRTPPRAAPIAEHVAARETLERYIAQQGLKSTRQRTVILETFLAQRGHVNVEELLAASRRQDGRVSAATVYRTMRLLTECGIAHARDFGDGQTRYEPATGREHHDHLICTGCGTIVEFERPAIERLQDEVAEEHGFVVTEHKLELYGRCPACQRRGQR